MHYFNFNSTLTEYLGFFLRISTKFAKMGKMYNFFFIGVSYFLQFKSFLWQTFPDIISAYWVYCNVKVIAKKKRKLNYPQKYWV